MRRKLISVTLCEDPQPYSANVAHRIPKPHAHKFGVELHKMRRAGITEPADRCSPAVVVKKKLEM